MSKYTIPCTESQTKKALKLGAPIEFETGPTAEEMVGWLEDQGEISDLHIFKPAIHWTFELYSSNGDGKNDHPLFNSRPEATIAAIDAALEYLADTNLIK